MDQTPRSSKSNINDDNSLGILSLDNLKVFGENSIWNRSSSNNKNDTSRAANSVSQRLHEGRMKALELLEQKPRSSKFFSSNYNDRNSTAINAKSINQMPYGSRKSVNSINISDLITDETINLNGSESSTVSATKSVRDIKISFEPSEITGRSTLYKSDANVDAINEPLNGKKPKKNGEGRVILSVPEILASSFAERARELTKKTQHLTSKKSSFSEDSTLGSLNNMQSLPHTADMSRANSSLNGCDRVSFSFGGAAVQQQSFDQGNFSSEFAPGELMQSKLALDEISWAYEYAAVPTATLSNKAKEKVKESQPEAQQQFLNNEIDTSVSNSVLANDPDFSVGSFFKKRSDNVWQITNSKSPIKMQIPSALLDNSEKNSLLSVVSSAIATPKPDNKTYTKEEEASKLAAENNKKKLHRKKNSDKEKEKDKSYLLSLSAIDRALRNLDLDTDTSTAEVVNKLYIHGHKSNKIVEDGYDSENKENEPTLIEGSQQHTDTLSFNESVLNSTDFRQMQQSINVSRTPLSPLLEMPQAAPLIKVTTSKSVDDFDNDADIDDWPSTPVKSPNRRVRRTKSPLINSTKSPDSKYAVIPTIHHAIDDNNEDDEEEKTPVNKKSNASPQISAATSTSVNRRPKSLCSTRLDGYEALTPTSADCDFGISPNLSKSANNQTLTNMNSPMSSPRSVLSSPLLDSTTNSERRFLMPGGTRKTISSPASSDTGSTCSSGAMRKVGSLANVGTRSISRCSNSSEFSHRDGKCLPLKVTKLELSWGSTKLRTDVRKSMQVKNIGEKRLVVRLGIHGPGFQLVSGESNMLTMQSQECRTIVINFCPTMCGVAVGMLSFYSPISSNNTNISLMDIPLYGFGGNANIHVQGLLKGPVGASFLPMGDVCELPSGTLQSSLSIYNKGPLTAFASISVDSTGLLKPRLSDAFEIKPNTAIIPANSGITVDIFFRPSREHIKSIIKKNAQVLTLATMRIICGDDPNRQRMRGLFQRMNRSERKQLTSVTLDNLWSKFPDEREVHELSTLKEIPEVILDLAAFIRIHEVALTLNRDFDESAESTLLFPQADESVLFRTICATNSPTPTQSNILEPVDELIEADTTSYDQSSPEEGSWSVKPESIKFNILNRKLHNTSCALFITNSYKSRQYIEITCSTPNIFRFNPSEGYVSPDGAQLEVEVRILQDRLRDITSLKKNVAIMVRMENECITIPVEFET